MTIALSIIIGLLLFVVIFLYIRSQKAENQRDSIYYHALIELERKDNEAEKLRNNALMLHTMHEQQKQEMREEFKKQQKRINGSE